MSSTHLRPSSSARRVEGPDAPQELRTANAALLTLIAFLPASLVLRWIMILGDMWAGWLTMWVVLAPSLFGLSWLVARLLGNSVQERLLRFLNGCHPSQSLNLDF